MTDDRRKPLLFLIYFLSLPLFFVHLIRSLFDWPCCTSTAEGYLTSDLTSRSCFPCFHPCFHPCILVRHVPCSPRVSVYAGRWKTVSGVKVRFPDFSHADLTQTASHWKWNPEFQIHRVKCDDTATNNPCPHRLISHDRSLDATGSRKGAAGNYVRASSYTYV